MKYFIVLALCAVAYATEMPEPVKDTPEVAMAKEAHFKAVEYQKALISATPYSYPYAYGAHPYAYSAHPVAYNAHPYNYYPYSGYYPYSQFNYGYSASATPYAYPYNYPYTGFPFAVKAKTE